MLYIPFIGASASATASLIEKLVLRDKKIRPASILVGLFLAAVIVMLPFMFFFRKISPEAWLPINILVLLGIVVFSIIGNLLSYYSLKREKLTNLEPVRLLEPLFVVLLAFAFFKSERNPSIIIPSIVAALALIFSHVRKHHLDFNKYIIAGMTASLFYAVDLILTKILLPYYNPLTLYFVRCAIILLVSAIIFHPNLAKTFTLKEKVLMVITASLWVTFRVATYYGYLYLGVVSTTLILMLAPVIIYILARAFLKEKLDWRNIAASIIILACVLYVTLTA